MKLDGKLIAVAVVLAALLIVGAYELGGRRQAGRQEAGPQSVKTKSVQIPGAQQAEKRTQREPVKTGASPIDDIAGKFTHFRVGQRNVKDIYADGKIMWIGFSGGLIRYDTATDQHRLFDTKSGLLSNGIFHVSKLGGNIALGTYGGGMSIYDGKNDEWETLNIPDGLGDAFVYDILETSWGDVWVATWSGVNRVKGGKIDDPANWELFTVENTSGGLPNDWVYGLAEGVDGEVWLATEGGMAKFKDEKWTRWSHKEGVGAPYDQVREDIKFKNDPGKYSSHHAQQKVEQGLQGVDIAYNPNYIVSLLVDRRDGTVWAGTWGGGLSKFDGKKWENLTVKDGLPGNHIFMLFQDKKGFIWIGTSAGLAKYQDGKFKVYTTKHGLFSDNVFSMSIDENDNLWVGSYGGVARIDKSLIN